MHDGLVTGGEADDVPVGRPAGGSNEASTETPVVITAGCIVMRHGQGQDEVLVVWTGDYPDPTLPKGKVESGESPEQCAVREVREETGYAVVITDLRPVTVEAILDKHSPVLRRVRHFFLAEVAEADGGSAGTGEGRLATPAVSRAGGSPGLQGPGTELPTRPGWLEVSEALRLILRREEREALEAMVARRRKRGR